MNWNDLNRGQQKQARELAARLGQSISQVAKHWDEVTDWQAGTITSARLAQLTGWDGIPGADKAADLRAERDRLAARIADIDTRLAALEDQ